MNDALALLYYSSFLRLKGWFLSGRLLVSRILISVNATIGVPVSFTVSVPLSIPVEVA